MTMGRELARAGVALACMVVWGLVMLVVKIERREEWAEMCEALRGLVEPGRCPWCAGGWYRARAHHADCRITQARALLARIEGTGESA